jgi:hypothetical protein
MHLIYNKDKMKKSIFFLYCFLAILAVKISLSDKSKEEGFEGDVDAYRAIIVRGNLKLIEENNRNPASTFIMHPYSQFLDLTTE